MTFMKLASLGWLGAKWLGAKWLVMGLVILMPKLAFAHLGHIGDLAGHGHLVGVAGLAAAGAGAVLWGILCGRQNETDDDTDEAIETASADIDVDADAVPENGA